MVVTCGDEGASLIDNGHEVARVAAYRANVVNTVGAGDAFRAAVTLSFASGLSPDHALRLAAKAGSDAVSHQASQPPLRAWSEYLELTA